MSDETKQSPLYWVMFAMALVAYGIFIYYLPFPGETKTWVRVVTGIVAWVVGLAIGGAVLGLVQFALKAIVEFAAIIVFLFNCCYCAVVWVSYKEIAILLEGARGVTQENVFWIVFIASALLLVLLDALAFLVLYPLAQIAGTDLVPPD